MKACQKKDLQRLVGHACKVVRPGRRFLRGMFELLSGSMRGHYYIRLNRQFRADLEWWNAFLSQWNGKSMLSDVYTSNPNVHIVSDASGSWGCAAYWNSEWFQVAWSNYPEFEMAPIPAKELLPILIAAALWGTNMAHMLRCLFFLEEKLEFLSTAKHIPGVENRLADALSRNQMSPEILKYVGTEACT